VSGRFDGRVAIVTASGRGIGRAVAARLASEGATVVINDVNSSAIDETVASIGPSAVPALGDITSETFINDMVARVVRDHGKVDILVNNAGGALPGASWATVADTTLADWESFLRFNLTASFLCSRAVLPSMTAQGWGRIVCVSSISATHGQRAGAGYASAKAGLHGFVASLGKEVAARGIAVNGIIIGNAPHPTRTPERQALLDQWVHTGRVGRHDEFAAAIAFLCSDDASYLSGSMLPVDGGFHRFNQL
jgi:NAD(P)-dependent dehydrogenase (short-subunit alcohol dehydrogenase family)